MKALTQKFILLALMCASAATASIMRPTISMAAQRPPIDLETMVPREFGEWREQTGMPLQVINPSAQNLVNKLYSETLTRVYVNPNGYRVMLSIAYGKDQSDALQVHQPEVCYPAQGFQLKGNERTTLDMPDRSIAATRLMTQLGQRVEPVTYWIVLGDHITNGGMDKKLKEMRYAMLDKTMPDGMLVRVSSIDGNKAHAHQMQATFATALVGSIAPEHRSRFAGTPLKQ